MERSTIVEYRTETQAVDFGVIQCIFKVKGHQKPYFALSAALKAFEQISRLLCDNVLLVCTPQFLNKVI